MVYPRNLYGVDCRTILRAYPDGFFFNQTAAPIQYRYQPGDCDASPGQASLRAVEPNVAERRHYDQLYQQLSSGGRGLFDQSAEANALPCASGLPREVNPHPAGPISTKSSFPCYPKS